MTIPCLLHENCSKRYGYRHQKLHLFFMKLLNMMLSLLESTRSVLNRLAKTNHSSWSTYVGVVYRLLKLFGSVNVLHTFSTTIHAWLYSFQKSFVIWHLSLFLWFCRMVFERSWLHVVVWKFICLVNFEVTLW